MLATVRSYREAMAEFAMMPKIEDGPWPAFPAYLTSIALAGRAPDIVRKLVLVDVTPGVDKERAAPIVPPPFSSRRRGMRRHGPMTSSCGSSGSMPSATQRAACASRCCACSSTGTPLVQAALETTKEFIFEVGGEAAHLGDRRPDLRPVV